MSTYVMQGLLQSWWHRVQNEWHHVVIEARCADTATEGLDVQQFYNFLDHDGFEGRYAVNIGRVEFDDQGGASRTSTFYFENRDAAFAFKIRWG